MTKQEPEPESTPGARDGAVLAAVPVWAWALFLIVIVVLSFGGFADETFPTNDDHSWQFHTKAMTLADPARGEEPIPLHRLLLDCFSDLRVPGHYQPVTRALWHLEYAVAGDERWMQAVVIGALAMHVGTVLLLVGICLRLGFPTILSVLAGLFAAIHPAVDIALSGANGSINVPALFFATLAAWLWLRTMPGRPLRPGFMIAAMLALFAACHSNPPFMAIGPLFLMALAMVARIGAGGAWRPWLVQVVTRSIPIVVIVAVVAWMRLVWYGALLTHVTRGTTFFHGKPWYEGLWNVFVSLQDSTDVVHARYRGIALPELHGPTVLGWIVAGLVVALGGFFTWWIAARGGRRGDRTPPSALAKATLLAIALIGAGAGTYFATRGGQYLHRYLYVAVPGVGLLFAVVATAVWSVLARCLPARAAAIAPALIVAVVVGLFARENTRSVASAVYGYRASKAVADGLAEVRWRHPELDRVFVLDLPESAGRAGLLFMRDSALTKGVEMALWRKTGLFPRSLDWSRGKGAFHETELLRRWDELGGDEALRARSAVMRFDRVALRLLPVREVSVLGALDHPETLRFPVVATDDAALDGESRVMRRDVGESVRLAGRPDRPSAALRSFERLLGRDPTRALAKLEALVRTEGQGAAPVLFSLLDWERPEFRDAAARELVSLWGLDDRVRRETLLRMSDDETPRAVARVLGTGVLEPDADCLELLLAREATALDYVVERSRRGDAAVRDLIRDLRNSESDRCHWRAVLAEARLGDPDARLVAGLLMLDERFAPELREDALRVVLAAGQPDDLDLVEAYVRGLPPGSGFWSRVPALVGRGPTSARLLMSGVDHEGVARPDLDGLIAAWRETTPGGVHLKAAVREYRVFRDLVASTEDPDVAVRESDWRRVEQMVRKEPLAIPEYWAARAQVELGRDPEGEAAAAWPETLAESALERWGLPYRGAILLVGATDDADPRLALRFLVERAPLPRPGSTMAFAVAVTNSSGRHLLGGRGPRSARIVAAVFRERDRSRGGPPVAIVTRDLPAAGVPAGATTQVPLALRLPLQSGKAVVVVALTEGPPGPIDQLLASGRCGVMTIETLAP